MSLYTFAQQFVFAILVGALVGIEREHARKNIGQKDGLMKFIMIGGIQPVGLCKVLEVERMFRFQTVQQQVWEPEKIMKSGIH